jgi:hypothetical protein
MDNYFVAFMLVINTVLPDPGFTEKNFNDFLTTTNAKFWFLSRPISQV